MCEDVRLIVRRGTLCNNIFSNLADAELTYTYLAVMSPNSPETRLKCPSPFPALEGKFSL